MLSYVFSNNTIEQNKKKHSEQRKINDKIRTEFYHFVFTTRVVRVFCVSLLIAEVYEARATNECDGKKAKLGVCVEFGVGDELWFLSVAISSSCILFYGRPRSTAIKPTFNAMMKMIVFSQHFNHKSVVLVFAIFRFRFCIAMTWRQKGNCFTVKGKQTKTTLNLWNRRTLSAQNPVHTQCKHNFIMIIIIVHVNRNGIIAIFS